MPPPRNELVPDEGVDVHNARQRALKALERLGSTVTLERAG